MLHCCPVSPLTPPTSSSSEGRAASSEHDTTQIAEHEDHEEVDFKDVLVGDEHTITGTGHTLHDGTHAGAIPPRALRSPTAMTPAEKAIHDLTHMPPHEGCEICKSTRAPNAPHTASHEHLRTIPLLVGDYCFLKSINDEHLLTCLVM